MSVVALSESAAGSESGGSTESLPDFGEVSEGASSNWCGHFVRAFVEVVSLTTILACSFFAADYLTGGRYETGVASLLGVGIGLSLTVGYSQLSRRVADVFANIIVWASLPVPMIGANFYTNAGSPWKEGWGDWKPLWKLPPDAGVREYAYFLFPIGSGLILSTALRNKMLKTEPLQIESRKKKINAVQIESSPYAFLRGESPRDLKVFVIEQIAKVAIATICIFFGWEYDSDPLVLLGSFILANMLGTLAMSGYAFEHMKKKREEPHRDAPPPSPSYRVLAGRFVKNGGAIVLDSSIVALLTIACWYTYAAAGALLGARKWKRVQDFETDPRRLSSPLEGRAKAVIHAVNAAFCVIYFTWHFMGIADPDFRKSPDYGFGVAKILTHLFSILASYGITHAQLQRLRNPENKPMNSADFYLLYYSYLPVLLYAIVRTFGHIGYVGKSYTWDKHLMGIVGQALIGQILGKFLYTVADDTRKVKPLPIDAQFLAAFNLSQALQENFY